jgi:hypothetical protein
MFGPLVLNFASQLVHERAQELKRQLDAWLPRHALREDCLSRVAVSAVTPSTQPGLFDKRALKGLQIADQQRRDILLDGAGRRASLEARATLVPAKKPEIALLLFTRC